MGTKIEQSDLLDAFIKALHNKINKRSDLVNYITDSLKIEKESASRRLNKKVYFSISEMGLLATKLGISIDGILKNKNGYSSPPSYTLHQPKSALSLDGLSDWIVSDLNLLGDVSRESASSGMIFNSLPIEFVIPYRSLLKFMYFKWGYYFIGSDEFNDFSSWQISPKLLSANDMIIDVYSRWESVTYIWDITSIYCLIEDVRYFSNLLALNQKDMESLKIDIHKMLYDLEKVAGGVSVNHLNSDKVHIYISTTPLGAQFSYYISKSKWYSSFHTYFVGSNYSDDHATCMQVRDWMNSIKKVCTLISHSGAKERKLFFERQHQIVDSI